MSKTYSSAPHSSFQGFNGSKVSAFCLTEKNSVLHFDQFKSRPTQAEVKKLFCITLGDEKIQRRVHFLSRKEPWDALRYLFNIGGAISITL